MSLSLDYYLNLARLHSASYLQRVRMVFFMYRMNQIWLGYEISWPNPHLSPCGSIVSSIGHSLIVTCIGAVWMRCGSAFSLGQHSIVKQLSLGIIKQSSPELVQSYQSSHSVKPKNPSLFSFGNAIFVDVGSTSSVFGMLSCASTPKNLWPMVFTWYIYHISSNSRAGRFPKGGKFSQFSQFLSISSLKLVNIIIQLGNLVPW